MKSALWKSGPLFVRGDGVFPQCADSILLADFVRPKKARRFLDAGCGSGIISLLLLYKYPELSAELIDIDSAAADNSKLNMEINGFTGRSSVINGDFLSLRRAERGLYGFIVSNPPYYRSGNYKKESDSRHDGALTIRQLAEQSSKLLGDGGGFFIVYPAARLAETIAELCSFRLEPKRIRFVHHNYNSPPSVFLLECRKSGNAGMTAEPPLFLKSPDGGDSPEIKRIYHLEDST